MEDKNGSVNINDWAEPQVTNTIHKYQIDYTKMYSNTIVVAVTNLDIWYMKYLANYTYDIEDSGMNKETTRLEAEKLDSPKNSYAIETGDIQYREGTWTTVSRRTEPINARPDTSVTTRSSVRPQAPTSVPNQGFKTIEDQKKVDTANQTKSNQRVFVSEYRTIQYKYSLDGNPEVIEKTNPKLKEGEEGYPNFCTLYLGSRDALRNITGIESRVESWLFEILENNIDTANMVELTKYMLYCATGNDYGVIEFNFESLYPTNLVSGLYGGTIEEQIWFALLDAGYSKEAAAGVLGNLKQESGIRSNNLQNTYEQSLGMSDEEYTEAVNSGIYTKFATDSAGYGLAQWTSEGRKRGLYLFAQYQGVSISDSSMQIEYLLGEISPTGGANGLAHFQMATSKGGYSYESWKNASTPEEAATAFGKVFERPKNQDMTNRATYAREIYNRLINVTKGDISIGNIELTGENKTKMMAMLNEAVRIANDDRYGYSQDNRNDEFYYDCSSLVYRLYQEYFGISVPNTTADYPRYSSYNIGNASNVTLQPGDILWRRKGDKGHVTIYLGNGNYVAAHSSKYPKANQISVYQDNPSRYMNVYRFVGR